MSDWSPELLKMKEQRDALRAQLAAAQAELECMEVRLIGAGAAQADLAEAARHVAILVAMLESIAHRATARNLVVEDWNHIGPEVDAARAWLAARGGER